ncbi:MAG: sugar transferase [Bacteriovorax sp. MedPE-SWde]|nr:MAG: sugar transferase [Bacteriovorax sp. MedPE-SWde]
MLKRAIDIVFSFLILIIVSPIILISAIVVLITMGSPIFFTQARAGKDGKLFHIKKFRSMFSLKPDNKHLTDEQRITKFGRFLRSSSIDELPGLFNVLKGEMSLVGPRPLLMDYLPLYSKEQARRHKVLPGITGWAQINGRNAISWEEKFRLDVWYVDNRSILLDIKILFLTVKKVLIKEGITAVEEVIMPRFKGSKSDQDE